MITERVPLELPPVLEKVANNTECVRKFTRNLELQEPRCHLFWAMVIFFDVFLLPLVLHYLSYRDWYFVYFVVGIVIAPMTLLALYLNAIDGGDFTPRSEVLAGGESEKSDVNQIWRQLPFRLRLWILLRQCVRLEFFGWIVFLCGSIGAVNNSLAQVIHALGEGPLETGTYVAIIDKAAYELTRAAIIGVMVLFFAQIMRQHRTAIDKTSDAARQAFEAVSKARLAINAVEIAIPELDKAIERGIASVRHAFGDFTRLQLMEQSNEKAKLLRGETLNLYEAILQELGESLTHLLTELSPAEGEFESACFYSLYLAYMTSESLSFVGKDRSGKEIEGGSGSCEFATRFVNYSMAVRRIVEALEAIEPGRFDYYTIFVGKPSRFLNVENRGADLQWSVDFLEFCQGHHDKNIHYRRYFIANRKHNGEGEQLYNIDELRDDLKSKVVCLRNSGLPFLWSSSRDVAVGYKALENVARSMKVDDPGFILNLVEDGELKEPELDLPEGFIWKSLGETLPSYFNPDYQAEVLEFFDLKSYSDLFGDERKLGEDMTLLPRDLFSVWDNKYGEYGGWRLCMGAMSPSQYGAVRLAFATSKRCAMRRGTWSEMTTKLNLLFHSEGKTKYFDKSSLLITEP
jgi:hypothetical protein